jgi:small conductance mechanosensitive channel
VSGLLNYIDPSHLTGALLLAAVFIVLAVILSWILKSILRKVIEHDTQERIDRLTVSFLGNFGSFVIWVVLAIFYAHLVPSLDKLGSALLAGAGIASVVVGLAAQSTLGNLVSGISLVLYKPFRQGDRIQVNAPTGLVSPVSAHGTDLRL